VVVYDPKVREQDIRQHVLGGKTNDNFLIAGSAREAAAGAHAIAILTEWDEFATLPYAELFENMPKPAFIFDGRNILPHADLRAIVFRVFPIGKPSRVLRRKSDAE
jgi:UDPglucose 6-dehydrogenase